MKNNLIGIAGHAQTGKDLVGSIIQYLIYQDSLVSGVITNLGYRLEDMSLRGEFCSNWSVRKFADKIKDIVCLLIGCTRDQLEDPVFKETELGEEWRVWKLLNVSGEIYASRIDAEEHYDEYTNYVLTPRLLMQLVGTDCGRLVLHPDIWVNATFADWKPYGMSPGKPIQHPNWLVTDVRMPNEAAAVKSRGGIIIRLERDDAPIVGGHISETALDTYTGFDYTIQNNGTVDELVEQVRTILTKEGLLQ